MILPRKRIRRQKPEGYGAKEHPELKSDLLIPALDVGAKAVDYSRHRRTISIVGGVTAGIHPAAGRVLTFSGSDSQLDLPAINYTGGLSAWTIFTIFRTTSTAVQRLLIEDDGNVSSFRFLTLFENGNGFNGEVTFGQSTDGGTTYQFIESAAGDFDPADGKPHVLLATQRSTTFREAFMDGKSIGTNTVNAGTVTFTRVRFGVQEAANYRFAGDLIACGYLPYYVSPAWVRAFSANPWGFLLAPKAGILVTSAPQVTTGWGLGLSTHRNRLVIPCM